VFKVRRIGRGIQNCLPATDRFRTGPRKIVMAEPPCNCGEVPAAPSYRTTPLRQRDHARHQQRSTRCRRPTTIQFHRFSPNLGRECNDRTKQLQLDSGAQIIWAKRVAASYQESSDPGGNHRLRRRINEPTAVAPNKLNTPGSGTGTCASACAKAAANDETASRIQLRESATRSV